MLASGEEGADAESGPDVLAGQVAEDQVAEAARVAGGQPASELGARGGRGPRVAETVAQVAEVPGGAQVYEGLKRAERLVSYLYCFGPPGLADACAAPLAHLRWDYMHGLYHRPAGTLHVSAGLGTTFIPFRFLARPEATELVLGGLGET